MVSPYRMNWVVLFPNTQYSWVNEKKIKGVNMSILELRYGNNQSCLLIILLLRRILSGI